MVEARGRWPRWVWVCPCASKKCDCGGEGRNRRGEKRGAGSREAFVKTLVCLWTLGKKLEGRDCRVLRGESGGQAQETWRRALP